MRVASSLMLLALVACTPDKNGNTDPETPAVDPDHELETDPRTYAFPSRFDGKESVHYGGQSMRQVLMEDMKTHLGGITGRIDDFTLVPASGDVESSLLFYVEFDSSTSGSVAPLQTFGDPVLQSSYDEVSTDKDLIGKLAGNDPVGQHQDWSNGFVGWPESGVTTPESLVRLWIAQIDDQAVQWAAGNYPLDPDGAPVPAVYVTPEGLDLQQLLEKLLRGGITYSQATDDYLDDDTPDKGLLSANDAPESGKNYTPLQHAWDEGFGYFGAAANYPAWSDEDIADLAGQDVNGDGFVDLTSEVNWGHSTNAAKRDLGSAPKAATDYTAQAWDGFWKGRRLLAESEGELSSADFRRLQGHRDQAVDAWERAIAASLVHYINEVLQDMKAMDTGDYDFGGHAKHWSEMKGFALTLQFNPRSQVSPRDFAELHALLDTKPVLEDATVSDRNAYMQDLRDARAILGDSYGFHTQNLGDADGENGW